MLCFVASGKKIAGIIPTSRGLVFRAFFLFDRALFTPFNYAAGFVSISVGEFPEIDFQCVPFPVLPDPAWDRMLEAIAYA